MKQFYFILMSIIEREQCRTKNSFVINIDFPSFDQGDDDMAFAEENLISILMTYDIAFVSY